MFSLLRQRNFFLLWIAHTLSILGDYVFFIAITFWIYEQTHSALATGFVLITSTIPALLFAPLAGMVVDHGNRRSIMLVAESMRAMLFLGLLGTLIAQPHLLWTIYVVGFLQSALAAFFWPARSALIPQMIGQSSLLAANALYMMSDSCVRILAPSLAALSLLHLGPPGVVIIDTASFVISAGSVCLLTNNLASTPSAPERPVKAQTRKKRWIDGNDKAHVRGLFLLGSIIAYTAGTLSILLPIFVQTTLSIGPLAYGWILTAQAIGGGAMSLVLEQVQKQKRWLNGSGFVSGCLLPGGLALMLLVYQHALIPILLLNLVFGAVTAGATVQLLTLLQQRIHNRFLGRTLARYTGIQALAQVSGMGISSMMLAHSGVTWFLLVDGALYLLGGAIIMIILRRVKKSPLSS